MRLPEENTGNDGPDLTPVIDVVFLLLIFFLTMMPLWRMFCSNWINPQLLSVGIPWLLSFRCYSQSNFVWKS